MNTTLPVTNSQISTHTLTWSVTKQVADGLKEYSDFNSHAHVERDIVGAVFKIFHFISTHTLTWSVTKRSLNNFCRGFISTHTLTWSVTHMYQHRVAESRHFNSHAHVERDFSRIAVAVTNNHFNSHAHVERDPLKSDNFPVFSHFNSHAHVERDTVREELEQAIKDFNSHAHVERDRRNLCRVLQGKISTHTLTWSVTHRLAE